MLTEQFLVEDAAGLRRRMNMKTQIVILLFCATGALLKLPVSSHFR
jgi:hypothetical protein